MRTNQCLIVDPCSLQESPQMARNDQRLGWSHCTLEKKSYEVLSWELFCSVHSEWYVMLWHVDSWTFSSWWIIQSYHLAFVDHIQQVVLCSMLVVPGCLQEHQMFATSARCLPNKTSRKHVVIFFCWPKKTMSSGIKGCCKTLASSSQFHKKQQPSSCYLVLLCCSILSDVMYQCSCTTIPRCRSTDTPPLWKHNTFNMSAEWLPSGSTVSAAKKKKNNFVRFSVALAVDVAEKHTHMITTPTAHWPKPVLPLLGWVKPCVLHLPDQCLTHPGSETKHVRPMFCHVHKIQNYVLPLQVHIFWEGIHRYINIDNKHHTIKNENTYFLKIQNIYFDNSKHLLLIIHTLSLILQTWYV